MGGTPSTQCISVGYSLPKCVLCYVNFNLGLFCGLLVLHTPARRKPKALARGYVTTPQPPDSNTVVAVTTDMLVSLYCNAVYRLSEKIQNLHFFQSFSSAFPTCILFSPRLPKIAFISCARSLNFTSSSPTVVNICLVSVLLILGRSGCFPACLFRLVRSEVKCYSVGHSFSPPFVVLLSVYPIFSCV